MPKGCIPWTLVPICDADDNEIAALPDDQATGQNREDNARLIAAAPCMLETCIDALESLEGMNLQDSIAQGVVNVLVNRFRFVVAKATEVKE